MQRLTDPIIEALGGLTEISRMTHAPISTVNGWRVYIPASRLDHLMLAAQRASKSVPWHLLEPAERARA